MRRISCAKFESLNFGESSALLIEKRDLSGAIDSRIEFAYGVKTRFITVVTSPIE
jgi:hypothetical protein